MTPGPPLEGKGEGNEGEWKGQGRAPIRLLAQGPPTCKSGPVQSIKQTTSVSFKTVGPPASARVQRM